VNLLARKDAIHNYELPSEDVTLDGYKYSPIADHWVLRALGTTKHFMFDDLIDRGLPAAFKLSFKNVIMVRVRAHSLPSAHVPYTDIRYFLRFLAHRYPDAERISMGHLMAYQASLPADRLYVASRLLTWILYWAELGIPGLDNTAVVYAEDAERSWNVSGKAVKTRCPINGPYTSLEFDGINKALHSSFALAEISLDDYCLCLISQAFAPRPAQLAHLMASDLKATIDNRGLTKYILAIPRAKRRGRPVRSEFKDRVLNHDMGMILAAQVAGVRDRAKAAGFDPNTVPMFPVSLHNLGNDRTDLFASPVTIGKRIARALERLDVKSERTGETINATPTRARRTLGTRLAQEGKPAAVIAEALDHSDLQSVLIYIEERYEMLARLNAQLGFQLAPLAQRFLGKIIQRGADAQNGVLKHVVGTIEDGHAPEDLGGCGKHSFCGLPKPLACYTCIQFRPWDDGPHAQLLEYLCGQRQKQAEIDVRIAESLDDTILAVAWVVMRCAQRATLIGQANDESH
jgi:hypothetical protein